MVGKQTSRANRVHITGSLCVTVAASWPNIDTTNLKRCSTRQGRRTIAALFCTALLPPALLPKPRPSVSSCVDAGMRSYLCGLERPLLMCSMYPVRESARPKEASPGLKPGRRSILCCYLLSYFAPMWRTAGGGWTCS